jgi:hypothetical protein
MSLYNQLGAAVSTAMEASSQKTSDHMNDRSSANSAGWAASTQKTADDHAALDTAIKAGYSTFDGQRTNDHQAMLQDMLENVIGGVTAAVAGLVADDATFDKQFADDNTARLAAWAEIAERIGDNGDIDIQ